MVASDDRPAGEGEVPHRNRISWLRESDKSSGPLYRSPHPRRGDGVRRGDHVRLVRERMHAPLRTSGKKVKTKALLKSRCI